VSVVLVVIGAAALIAAMFRIQVVRRRAAPVRQAVASDPVNLVIPVHVKPKVQFGLWGKTLALMRLQVRGHSLSLVLGANEKLGSILGSEWHLLAGDTTIRREQIESPLGSAWIVLSGSQAGKAVEVAVRARDDDADVWSALLNAGVHPVCGD
jgi:hypothetical protein